MFVKLTLAFEGGKLAYHPVSDVGENNLRWTLKNYDVRIGRRIYSRVSVF